MKYANILVTGSTRSGKTSAEKRRLVEAAEDGAAIVVADPHRDSLAAGLMEALVARGHQKRIIFDRLGDFDRVIGFDFVPRPASPPGSLQRLNEVDELARSFIDILLRRRQMESLATAALTEEWLLPAIMLYIEQEDHPELSILNYAFGPTDHPAFRRLLHRCTNRDVADRFREIEKGKISRGQYAPAERLLKGVCGSPAFAARCGSTFQLGPFLDRRGILLIEGGGNVSDDAQRTILGSAILQTIRHVRSRSRPNPPIILCMDEANNAGLIGASGYEMRAAAECQKMGLALHVLVQSLNFPSAEITEGMLTNCLVHEWFFAANEAVIRKATADLGSKDYEADLRSLKPGERMVKDRNHGVYREYVPLLDDPWGFPGLGKKKAERALEEIKRTRPEYRTPTVIQWHTPDPSPSDRQPSREMPLLPPESQNTNLGI